MALSIAEAAAETPSRWSAAAFQLLAELHARGLGAGADPAQAELFRRRAWLLALARETDFPFASDDELDAYLGQPETIEFLARYADVPGLPRARLRLGRALLARGLPEDRDRALELLADLARVADPEERFIFARAIVDHGGSASQRERALRELRSLARSHHQPARELIASVVRRQLASRSPQERWEAIESLGHLAYGLDPDSVDALTQAVTAANGGRPPPRLSAPLDPQLAAALAPLINDEDYPAAALRNEESGVVTLRGLLDPRGRLIFTEPTTPGQNPRLLNAVRRIFIARWMRDVDLGGIRTAPYVWVELPPVTFRFDGPRRGSVHLPFSQPRR
jgi:hypothetical protein